MKNQANKAHFLSSHILGCLGLSCALLISGPLAAQTAGTDDDLSAILQQLTDEKQLLTSELEQFHKTLALLQSSNTPMGEESNPAVRSLTEEAAVLKERLIAITEKEVSPTATSIISLSKRAHSGNDRGRTGTTRSSHGKQAAEYAKGPLQ